MHWKMLRLNIVTQRTVLDLVFLYLYIMILTCLKMRWKIGKGFFGSMMKKV